MKIKICLILILTVFLFSGCSEILQVLDNELNSDVLVSETETGGGSLKVHFIDVGQGDAALVTKDDIAIMIDAGPASAEGEVKNYLNKLGIENIDILILTHPHEDHIGNADYIIENFNVSQVFMPKVTHTTKTFQNLIAAMTSKNLTPVAPVSGEEIEINGVFLKFFAPNNSKYEDLNNYSIVCKLTYKNDSFLFTGDAEKLSENEILNKYGSEIESDVLKVGHHGSNTSTSPNFLNAVSPKVAVISVAKENDYGHPTPNTLNTLRSIPGIEVLMTKDEGDIVIESDGDRY